MTESVDAGTKKPLNKLWVIIVGIGLLGMYAAMYIPASVGERLEPATGLYSIIWNWLFFYLLWKARLRKGWHGGLIGLVVGLLAFFLASFLAAYIRASGGAP